jgi:hypothetical protein
VPLCAALKVAPFAIGVWLRYHWNEATVPLPPLAPALRATLPPLQNVVGPAALIVTAGVGLTVTATGADVAEQPLALVTVTL